jgi:thiosulfate/3-mercaptopyruvate sulfurtransferase
MKISPKSVKKFPNLISCTNLQNLLSKDSSNLRILDCAYPLGNSLENFKKERIPHAKFLDLSTLKEPGIAEQTLPLPRIKTFSKFVKRYDIDYKHNIILYDQKGIWASPRAWLIFKLYKFPNVAVLDGGFPKWKENNLPIDKNPIMSESLTYLNSDLDVKRGGRGRFEFEKSMVVNYENILSNEKNQIFNVIDSRNADNYNQDHIGNSKNIPFSKYTNKDGTMKSKEELEELLKEQGIEKTDTKPIVTSCQVGLSASIAYFAMNAILGKKDAKYYPGSYEEYSKKKSHSKSQQKDNIHS